MNGSDIEAGLQSSPQSGGGSGDGGGWVAVLGEITGIELTQSGGSLKRSVAFERHQLFSVWSLRRTQGNSKRQLARWGHVIEFGLS